MNRIDHILGHPLFRERLARLEALEADRALCRHDLSHLLDVARLMWIWVLEEDLPIPRETVYAAALLHDLGRADQLERGIPHEEAGAELALKILPEVGFTENACEEIRDAILGHRRSGAAARSPLGELLYRADKACRPCWHCPASAACNWPDEMKNTGITR